MPDSASTSTPLSSLPAATTDPAAHLGELTRIISADLIDAALDTTNGRHQRLRRLPSHTFIYLILAGVLFAEQGWRSGLRPPDRRDQRPDRTGGTPGRLVDHRRDA
ncbi:MAG: transposase domain-containing protein [Halopseudomonas yangmingensis]